MLITTVDNLRSEHIPQSQQTNHDALATVPTAAGGSQYMVTPGFRRSLARLGSETNRELVTLATERAVRRLLDGRLLHRTVTPLRILRLLRWARTPQAFAVLSRCSVVDALPLFNPNAIVVPLSKFDILRSCDRRLDSGTARIRQAG